MRSSGIPGAALQCPEAISDAPEKAGFVGELNDGAAAGDERAGDEPSGRHGIGDVGQYAYAEHNVKPMWRLEMREIRAHAADLLGLSRRNAPARVLDHGGGGIDQPQLARLAGQRHGDATVTAAEVKNRLPGERRQHSAYQLRAQADIRVVPQVWFGIREVIFRGFAPELFRHQRLAGCPARGSATGSDRSDFGPYPPLEPAMTRARRAPRAG